MTGAGPPAAEDDNAYVYFDHREEEVSIIENVSTHLAPEHALTITGDDPDLFVTYRGDEYKIPLTISPHDRYVAVSSLAELLKDDYRFFVLVPSLDTDTHAVLVAPASQAAGWVPLPGHLEPLRLGFDYFSGIEIPYLNNEEAAPNFAAESDSARSSANAMSQLLVSAILGGKVDANASAELAKAAMTNPKLREHADFPKNMSEAEIAAEIQKAMKEALEDPEVVGHRRDIGEAMRELRNLTTPRKPWWRFW
jgi:hypothetical protein